MLRIAFDPQRLLGAERGRRLDPLSQLAIVAVEHARKSALLELGSPVNRRMQEGVVVGSALGAFATTVRYARRLVAAGPAATNPIDFPDSIDGAPAAHVALELGLGGPSLTFSDGTSSAMAAMIHAARTIAWGRARRMHVVVGDCCDDWLAEAMLRDPRPMSDDVGHNTRLGECVFALVLEAEGQREGTPDSVELEGFLGANAPLEDSAAQGSGARPSETDRGAMPLAWFVDVQGKLSLAREPSAGARRLVDPSGALALAGAWLGAVGPITNIDGGLFAEVPEPIAARVNCGRASCAQLAFARTRVK